MSNNDDVYTLSEFSEAPEAVIEQVSRSGRPAAITSHGRFVAMITPLSDEQVMAKVLSEGPIADELDRREASAGPRYTSEEVLAMLNDDVQTTGGAT